MRRQDEPSAARERAWATAAAVAPFAVWMLLLTLLPKTPAGYALRVAGGAAALAAAAWRNRAGLVSAARGAGARGACGALLEGVLAGVAVGFLWVWPEETFAWYRRWCMYGGGTVSTDASTPGALVALQLFGSAFVIAPIEEVFYRSFLYRWLQRGHWTQVDPRGFDLSAFVWTVALFALGHNRVVAAVMAGVVYGLLAVRRGLGTAVVAHVTTNLALGLYVIRTGHWTFW